MYHMCIRAWWSYVKHYWFHKPWVKKQFWLYQIYKYYQNISSTVVFAIVFGIHCNFFIVLLKIYKCNAFVFFTKCPRQKDRHPACNSSRPAEAYLEPNQTSTIELFYENSLRLKVVNYFHAKISIAHVQLGSKFSCTVQKIYASW